MKRLLMILLAMMLFVPACADTQTTILGQMADHEYIHQYAAPNGQLLWFTAREEQPCIKMEDVNFDGAEDIVVFVVRGASNFFTEFFLYDAQQNMYVLAVHPGEEIGICNYVLHPELGIVEAQANNGSAGACHEYRLYRWQGTKLDCIRTARSEELTVSTHTGSVFTMTTYTDKLHMTVRDHTLGDWDEALVWEKVITMGEEEYRVAHEEELNALWQGLR